MLQNKTISLTEFKKYNFGIEKSYEIKFLDFCPTLDQMSDILFGSVTDIEIETLLEISENLKNNYVESYIKRLVGIREIIYCRDNKLNLSIPFVWKNIKESIEIIPPNFTISSIGSQGFLSIPLYKNDENLESFDFLRLHIWDESLDKLMDLEKNKTFSIHTHTFFARSWIISGRIINNRFDYKITNSDPTHSLFRVEYNNSLNQVNKHTSIAVNQNKDVVLTQISEEIHDANSFYEIEAGRLHQSGHLGETETSATFFSFTGKEGLGVSVVVGPKEIQTSEVNRKINIDPKDLLQKIDNQLR